MLYIIIIIIIKSGRVVWKQITDMLCDWLNQKMMRAGGSAGEEAGAGLTVQLMLQ